MGVKFTMEDIDKLLDYPTIMVNRVIEIPGEFNRVREFVVRQVRYTIEWYVNTSYLVCGDLKVPFLYAKQSRTWPSRSKMNLQFYGQDGSVVAVLKIRPSGN